ncbi:MAG: cell division protein FtsB [Lysobacter sp.]
MHRLRLLMVALLVLFAFLQYRLWLGVGGSLSVDTLDQQVKQQARENAGLKQRNDALAAEVEDLKSGEAAVEERARSELGMIKPGETFYRVVEPEGSSTAAEAGATQNASTDANSSGTP